MRLRTLRDAQQIIRYDDGRATQVIPNVLTHWMYDELSPPKGKNKFYTQQNTCYSCHVLAPANFHTNSGIHVEGPVMEPHIFSAWTPIFTKAWNDVYIELDFQSNNQFELIPFLMEIDETINLMFEDIFDFLWSRPPHQTYFEFQWSLKPLLSDITSIVNSISDMYDGIIRMVDQYAGRKVSRRCPIRVEHTDQYWEYVAEGTFSFKGIVNVSGAIPENLADGAAVFLDEIGLNLDLRTLWDISPLSFVIDYFLPIGDMLESLHPRGWFTPELSLYGSSSMKLDVSLTGPGYGWGWHWGPMYVQWYWGNGGKYRCYWRTPAGALTVRTRPPVHPEFKTPSQQGIVNTLLLLLSGNIH